MIARGHHQSGSDWYEVKAGCLLSQPSSETCPVAGPQEPPRRGLSEEDLAEAEPHWPFARRRCCLVFL